MENKYQTIAFLLKRLYREIFTSVQKAKTASGFLSKGKNSFSSVDPVSKYTDSLNILNLTPEEL